MILADIIPLRESPAAPTIKAISREHEEFPELHRQVETLLKHPEIVGDVFGILGRTGTLDGRTPHSAIEALADKRDTMRGALFAKHGALPPSLHDGLDWEVSPTQAKAWREPDFLSKAQQTPQVSMKSVIRLADRLGFMVMPFDYLDRRVVTDDEFATPETQDQITAFQDKLGEWFDFYVVCPPSFYSMRQHIEAATELPLIAPSTARQAFMAIDVSVSMFRTMMNDIKALRNRQDGQEERLRRLDDDVKNLARKVDSLQQQVDDQQAAIMRQRLEAQAQRAQIAKFANLERERRLRIEEPMMLAVPKGLEVTSAAAWALVGPCWGPDFDDVIAAGLELEVVSGQRERLAAAVKALVK